MYGAEGRTRTGTAYATAPSRRRVYQFHHFGIYFIVFSNALFKKRVSACKYTTLIVLNNYLAETVENQTIIIVVHYQLARVLYSPAQLFVEELPAYLLFGTA